MMNNGIQGPIMIEILQELEHVLNFLGRRLPLVCALSFTTTSLVLSCQVIDQVNKSSRVPSMSWVFIVEKT